MVSWQGIVNRIWKNVEAVVEEEDQKQYNEREDAKLSGSADLRGL